MLTADKSYECPCCGVISVGEFNFKTPACQNDYCISQWWNRLACNDGIIKTEPLKMNTPLVNIALEKLRKNKTMQALFTRLENVGFTVHVSDGGEITCTHEHTISRMSLKIAQELLPYMETIARKTPQGAGVEIRA
jgi:hypothetical protein